MATSITDVRLELPSLAEVWSVLTLDAGFNSAVVILGTTCLGVGAGIVGTFALLRKRALMADTLAHCSLPGLCIAFIVATALGFAGRSLEVLLLGATLSGTLGVLCVQVLTRYTRLSEDTAMGAVLSVFFGLGVVLLSYIQSLGTGSEGGLQHFIYGQTAAMNMNDAVLTMVVAFAAVVVAGLFLKEFRLVCFDENFARAQGWPVAKIDLLMMILLVTVTVIGLQAVGLILIIALIVVPAASARFWTEKMNLMTALAGLFGALSGYFGASVSTLLPRAPAGSVIVLTSGVIFLVSFLFAPPRGVLALAWRRMQLSMSVSRDHLLRAVYEILEARGGLRSEAANLDELRLLKQQPRMRLYLWLLLLQRQGLFVFDFAQKSVAFTARGLREARRLTRRHRLWEEYLLAYSAIASNHVDYSADAVEHVLSAELVRELETALRNKGRMPEELAQPKSVHPVVA